jgi:UDP-N-acetylglucosamine 2-epimerase (non-hydrolysing)
MLEFEKVLIKEKPDLIIVFGDVNSTMACSIVASKLNIKIAHVEAGLRSFDRTMPEEINRIITDVIADYLYVSEKIGLENLKNEGIDEKKVFFTGNIMIDNILFYQNKINQSKVLIDLDLNRSNYILVTFHRPKNVDGYEYLNNLVTFLNNISAKRTVVFPVHPRTKKNMIKNDLLNKLTDNIKLIDPIGYIDFLALIQNAELAVTDSGGIQEETTFLKVQCITVRDNTERPCTITEGTNQLIGTNLKLVEKTVNEILSGDIKIGKIPELWDGKTAERIVKNIINNFSIANL